MQLPSTKRLRLITGNQPLGMLRAWLPAALACAWMVVNIVLIGVSFIPNRFGPSDHWLSFVLGLTFAQLSYGGFWIVFGPGSAVVRIPWAVGGATFAAAGFLRHFIYAGELELPFVVVFLLTFCVFQFLLIAFSLLLQRYFLWEVAWEGVPTASQANQFTVRDLLGWMAGVGVMISLLRWVFGEVNYTSTTLPDLLPDLLIALLELLVVALAALIQAVVAGWAALRSKTLKSCLIELGLSLLVAFAGAISLGGDGDNFLIVLELLLTLYVALRGCLTILSWSGLRLTQRESIFSLPLEQQG